MNIRKIAVLGGLAVGAAVALSPVASADNLTDVVDTEISSLNALFIADTDLAGDNSDVTGATSSDPFDVISHADISTVQGDGTTPFDYLTYGVDASGAGLASDPGSYNLFNGAAVEFDDAFNTEAYSLLNNGATIPDTDLIGSSTTIADALASSNPADFFLNFGLGDLQGFFDIPSL
jgi:hypothetical protein